MGYLLTCLYFVGLAMALQIATFAVCARHKALRPWRGFLQFSAFMWLAAAVIKKLFIDDIFPPVDGLKHEYASRYIADLLTSGRISEAFVDYLGVGNFAYQFALGIFYALTDAPEVVTYAVNASFGYWGMLILLEILCSQTKCVYLPTSVVVIASLLPSGLLWTASNLKEGPILWGICAMCYWSIPLEGCRIRPPRILPVLGLATVCVMRPHIGLAWLSAVCAGTLFHTKRYSLLLVAVVGVVLSLWLLSGLRPDMFQRVANGSVTETLSEFYNDNSSHFSGGSTLEGGTLIPVVSGLTLILFRPWPTEVEGIGELFASIEVWVLAAYGLWNWARTRHKQRIIASPGIITHLILLILMGFFFTYMYNMGIVVRQRLMCMPAVLAIYSWPLLAAQEPIKANFKRFGGHTSLRSALISNQRRGTPTQSVF